MLSGNKKAHFTRITQIVEKRNDAAKKAANNCGGLTIYR
jgi:hypothetical protein